MTATAISNSRKARASRDAVWVSNGRLVSHTINEPEIKKEIEQRFAELRKNPKALLAYYVGQGVLTKRGKLTKRYGG